MEGEEEVAAPLGQLMRRPDPAMGGALQVRALMAAWKQLER